MTRNISWFIIKHTIPILSQNTIDIHLKRLGKWQETLTHKETDSSNSSPKHDRHISEETWKMTKNIRWLTKKQTIPILSQNTAIHKFPRSTYIWRDLENDKKHSLTHNKADYSNSPPKRDRHIWEKTWKMTGKSSTTPFREELSTNFDRNERTIKRQESSWLFGGGRWFHGGSGARTFRLR